DGFHATVRAVTETLATTDHPHGSHINLLPGFVSPADLRYLKEICATWSPHPPVVAPGGSPGLEGSSGAPAPAGAGPIPAVLLPDYSDTLDGGQWDTYQEIPIGGTPVSALKTMGQAKATIEFGLTIAPRHSAADFLEQKHGIPAYHLGLPIGVRQTDLFLAALEKITGTPPPAWLAGERGRLLDAYVDGHKHCFGQRAIVYGEEDLVVGIAAFLAEVGILPVLLGSGGESGRFAEAAHAAVPNLAADTVIKEGVDFVQLSQLSADLHPDLVIGSSKGYPLARDLRIPLVRTGFPIHDRLGGQRVLHLGYRGAMSLLDRITDAILMRKQETSDVGYAYL
ncbi:MAG: nitrogenase component 1, partial [Phycisphaerae bacterium]